MTRQQPLHLDPFYPIVPDADWVARIVPLGVKTVQLRMKDCDDAEVARHVRRALDICGAAGCQLIVNDAWQIAIEAGADAVHLGQDDLRHANVKAIRSAGMRLGISTHDSAELATAFAVNPDYIALGPIFETTLKVMPWRPQGLERLTTWRQRIGDLPLVAIGGLTTERASQALSAGANSAAVITDFVTAADPLARIQDWVAWSKLMARSTQRDESGR